MERRRVLAAERLYVDPVRAVKVARVERFGAVEADGRETRRSQGFEPEEAEGFVVHALVFCGAASVSSKHDPVLASRGLGRDTDGGEQQAGIQLRIRNVVFAARPIGGYEVCLRDLDAANLIMIGKVPV